MWQAIGDDGSDIGAADAGTDCGADARARTVHVVGDEACDTRAFNSRPGCVRTSCKGHQGERQVRVALARWTERNWEGATGTDEDSTETLSDSPSKLAIQHQCVTQPARHGTM